MGKQKTAKVTISLTRELLDCADRLARERALTRSGVIAELLSKEAEAKTRAFMAEGYRVMGMENLRESEEALGLTSEVVLRDA